MSSLKKRIAIYARCSTSDQSTEAQLRELKNYSAARGWTIMEELEDVGFTGTNGNRPGLKRLMQLARTRKIDTIVILKLDRLFRSLKHLVSTLQEWQELGVELVSVCDQVDMTTAAGRLFLHLLASFSEFEAALAKERTLIGLANARAKGKRLGRPAHASREQIIELRSTGKSYREIRKALGCSSGAITAAIKDGPKSGSKSLKNPNVITEV